MEYALLVAKDPVFAFNVQVYLLSVSGIDFFAGNPPGYDKIGATCKFTSVHSM